MPASDIFTIIRWWLTIFIIGIAFLPLTSLLFKSFFDKGYIFSKILGIIIISYIILLSGLLHIFKFNTVLSYAVLFSISVGLFFILRKKQNIPQVIKERWKIFVFEELLFISTIFFWTYIRSFEPNIQGLEKYMDYGFINSILRSDYFPPKDMWFTPFFINYYYFGHLMTAVLTKLSNLPSNLTFNLMLATIFAFCFTESFSIAANLYNAFAKNLKFLKIKRFIAGFISAMLITLGGNLHILYAFFKAYPNENPIPIWQLPLLPFSFPNDYWYPNATRFIYNTIHEFPIYSWVVADLHGHVLDIPIVLLTIALLLSMFFKSQITNHKSQINSKKQTPKTSSILNFKNYKLFSAWNFEFWYLLLTSFLLAVMYMTNAWDGAIYFLLTLLIIIYLKTQNFIDLKKIVIYTLIVLFGFIIFTLPFNINFKPFVSGIGVLCAPDFLIAKQKLGPLIFEANHCQRSPWWQLLMLYGFFYFFIISFLIFISKIKKLFQTDQFILLLVILSTFLIVLPEFVYVKDIYPAHYRANTMFKLVFQAFIMLSLASGYIIVRILSNKNNKLLATCYLLLAIVLISTVMLYPYQAINSYYGGLKNYKGFDGTAYLKTLYINDFAAMSWLNKNIKGQPVILEAQGDSYTDYARVSTNTGLPTVLGWTVHEWLWRGTYDIPAPRINEVKALYETKNINATKQLLEKYNIKYIFIGTLEYQKYSQIEEEKFKQLGKQVFQKGATKIYQIN